ncbi:MAG: outer-membrane lipoprotein carrier protein LolA [Dysgonamonadaceae bacterium]|jgi:outer membrane lipoprotein-sorting protein|nr:outer-membrane lipoprotein carrier protein LolA [Dysgonamonadaceae bacterium]
MKILFYTLLFVLIPVFVPAQNSDEARKILDKTYGLYEESNGIKLSFNITLFDAEGEKYPAQSGVALIKKNKFKLETDEMETWFDGKTQWVLIKETNEVNISNPTSKEIASISPLALLSMYKNGYSLGNPVLKTVRGKAIYQIEMTSNSQQCDFKCISVWVNKQNYSVLQVELTMKDNTKSLIDISNYNANNNFSDATFVFNKVLHPEVEIIDLR